MTAKEELAKLKREVEELKAKLAPPKPFVPEPYQQYDPTAGMCMPRSVMEEMARAVPDRVVHDIAVALSLLWCVATKQHRPDICGFEQ